MFGLHSGVRASRLILDAPVAQLDRVSDFESEGRMFESCRVYHLFLKSRLNWDGFFRSRTTVAAEARGAWSTNRRDSRGNRLWQHLRGRAELSPKEAEKEIELSQRSVPGLSHRPQTPRKTLLQSIRTQISRTQSRSVLGKRLSLTRRRTRMAAMKQNKPLIPIVAL